MTWFPFARPTSIFRDLRSSVDRYAESLFCGVGQGAGPAVALGGGGPQFRVFSFLPGRGCSCWSGRWKCLQSADRASDRIGPSPTPRESELQPAAAADEVCGDAEDPHSHAFGLHRRASLSRATSICIQAVSSDARATSSHQMRFWSKSCSGRLRSPVSLALWMRSSQRARRRWRSSTSASCPVLMLVTKQVKRCP